MRISNNFDLNEILCPPSVETQIQHFANILTKKSRNLSDLARLCQEIQEISKFLKYQEFEDFLRQV